MKLLEEYNQTWVIDLFDQIKVSAYLQTNVQDLIKVYKDTVFAVVKEIPIVSLKRSFKQQDFLRCRGYFPTREKLIEAVNALRNHPRVRIIRIKNRIQALGDVMINYWYDETCIGEAQLVLQTFENMTEAEINKAYSKIKFNHFCYELERNPIGCIVHCVELLIKEEAEKAAGGGH